MDDADDVHKRPSREEMDSSFMQVSTSLMTSGVQLALARAAAAEQLLAV